MKGWFNHNVNGHMSIKPIEACTLLYWVTYVDVGSEKKEAWWNLLNMMNGYQWISIDLL